MPPSLLPAHQLHSSATQGFVQMQTPTVGLGSKAYGDEGRTWRVGVGALGHGAPGQATGQRSLTWACSSGGITTPCMSVSVLRIDKHLARDGTVPVRARESLGQLQLLRAGAQFSVSVAAPGPTASDISPARVSSLILKGDSQPGLALLPHLHCTQRLDVTKPHLTAPGTPAPRRHLRLAELRGLDMSLPELLCSDGDAEACGHLTAPGSRAQGARLLDQCCSRCGL